MTQGKTHMRVKNNGFSESLPDWCFIARIEKYNIIRQWQRVYGRLLPLAPFMEILSTLAIYDNVRSSR